MQTETQPDTMCMKLSTSICACLLTHPKHKNFSKKSDLIIIYSRRITLGKLGWKNINLKCLRGQRESYNMVLKLPQDYFLTDHPKLMEMPLRPLGSKQKSLSLPQTLLCIKTQHFHF